MDLFLEAVKVVIFSWLIDATRTAIREQYFQWLMTTKIRLLRGKTGKENYRNFGGSTSNWKFTVE